MKALKKKIERARKLAEAIQENASEVVDALGDALEADDGDDVDNSVNDAEDRLADVASDAADSGALRALLAEIRAEAES